MFKSSFLPVSIVLPVITPARGIHINHAKATQHNVFLAEDYRRLKKVGIHAAREGVCWPEVDCGGHYDLSSLHSIINASSRYGIEIIYDLCHFGYPEDLKDFSKEFTKRFADYCYAVARYVATHTNGTCYFTPMNEPSDLSWAAGEAGLFAPHLTGRGFDLTVSRYCGYRGDKCHSGGLFKRTSHKCRSGLSRGRSNRQP